MALQSKIKPVELVGEKVNLIDQTLLPYEYKSIEITNYKDIAVAIKDGIIISILSKISDDALPPPN